MDYHVKYGGKLLKFADKLIKMAKEFVLEGLYYLRVIDSGGTVANRGLVEDLYKLWEQQGRLDNIKVAILPQAGGVQRTSGIYRFFSKLFTLRTDANDVTQTTANSQPYVVNGAMVNPNGAVRFMTHPTVSFGAGDAWSLSVLVMENSNDCAFLGNNQSLNNYLITTGTQYSFRGHLNFNSFSFGNNTIRKGKYTYITVVHSGDGNTKAYVNGVLSKSDSYNNSRAILTQLMTNGSLRLSGSLSYHLIQSGIITPTQILEEYNLLRSYIPEITTTLIGTKNIATENCQMVATPMGRVITLQNTPETWATASTIYANTYAATSGTVAQKTSAALLAAAMWRSPDSDHDKQAVFGKIYNEYAAKLLAFDIAAYNTANPSTPWGYHVMTRAEEQALAALDADTLKSNDLWTSTNGTNETGLSLLGSGVINADGTYSNFGTKTRLMTGEGYALDVNDDGTSAEIAVTTEGGILRLVKD